MHWNPTCPVDLAITRPIVLHESVCIAMLFLGTVVGRCRFGLVGATELVGAGSVA